MYYYTNEAFMSYTAAHHKGVIEEIHTISVLGNDIDKPMTYGAFN